MREYRGPNGERCLWYDQEEIEKIAEVELRKAGLMPTVASCAVDLERFIEAHLRAALDQYAELPDGVLGVTEFIPGRPPRISINRDLSGVLEDEDPLPGSVGRLRATLAHEAAHVLLHRVLYEVVPASLHLFPDETTESSAPPALHRCPKTAIGNHRPRADWREVQANRGMAALLMPRRVFGEVARSEISQAIGSATIGEMEISLIVPTIAARFAVSKQAATIRLRTLGFVPAAGQQSL
jgi:hypothetical protein